MPECSAMLRASDQLADDLRLWAALKTQVDRLTAQLNHLRDRISAEVEAAGYADESGHIRLPLAEPFEFGGKRYEGIKRERRVSPSVNHERLEALAEQRGLTDRLFPLRPVADEEEIYVLYQEQILTEADVDALFDYKVTWAFKPETADA